MLDYCERVQHLCAFSAARPRDIAGSGTWSGIITNHSDIQAPVPPSSSEVQAFLSLRVTDRDLLYVENDTRRAVCSAYHPKLGNITGSIPFSVLLSAIQATVSKYNPQRLLRRHRQQGHGHRDAGRRRGGTVAPWHRGSAGEHGAEVGLFG